MQVGLWGWDGSKDWRKVLVDSSGHLQVDVLSSTLPSGAATYGMQHLGNQYLDLIRLLLTARLPSALDGVSLKVKEQSPITNYANYGQANIRNQLLSLSYTKLAGGLPSTLDTDSLKVREQGTPSVHLYGIHNSTWYNLKVESAANPNLRVKLFDGADGIDSSLLSGAFTPDATRALIVDAALRVSDSGGNQWAEWRSARAIADGNAGLNFPSIALLGYNGSTWDRLRSYNTGILKVEKADIGATVALLTLSALVSTGAHDLFWVACTPDSPNAEWELSDDLDGSTTEKYCHFDTDKHSDHINFDPPLHFSTGIYVKKFDHMKCLHLCYI